MAYTNCDVATGVIAALGTNPSERALTTAQFKAKFDEFGTNFITWFNDTHLPELPTALTSLGLVLPTENLGYSGIIATLAIDSATTVAVGDVLYKAATGYKKAQANANTTLPAVAIALEAGTGSNRLVLLLGYFKNTSWNNTIGARAWLDTATAGAVTTTQPTTTGNQIQDLGHFETADTLFFNPNACILEV